MNLRDLIGVLGHELRTPLAAILGYQELLADGLYGDLSAAQREPVERIHQSALHLVHLLDGLQELAEAGITANDEIAPSDTGQIATTLLRRLQPFAESRSVRLAVTDQPVEAFTEFRLERFLRAAEIAMIAAIKTSHGSTLRLECSRSNGAVTCALHGCALDPSRDHPDRFDLASNGPPPTAAQLRLAMAAASLRIAGGALQLIPSDDRTTLELTLPAIG